MDVSEIQDAFRRGVRGAAAAGGDAGAGLAEDAAGFGRGANEALLLGVDRMAGLGDARAAYETGRALRKIVKLFDQAGAPALVGRQFIDNLGAAVMAGHMRRHGPAWGATETADMFVEMYARILGGPQREHDRVRRSIIDYALAGSGPRRREAVANGRTAWFLRPPGAG